MKHLYYLVLCSLACSSTAFAALTRTDLMAINTLEKELQLLMNKRSFGWEEKAKNLILQLKQIYVPKGYDIQKISNFIEAVSPHSMTIEAVKSDAYQQNDNDKYVGSSQQQSDVRVLPTEQIAYPQAYKSEHIIKKAIDSPAELQGKMEALLSVSEQEKNSDWEDKVEQLLFDIAAQDRDLAHEYRKKIYTFPVVKNSGRLFNHVIQEAQPAVVTTEQEQQYDMSEPLVQEAQIIEQGLEPVIEQAPIATQPVVVPVTPEQTITHEAIPVQEPRVEKSSANSKSVDQITTELNKLIELPAAQKNDAWESKMTELIFELYFHDKTQAAQYLKKIYKQPVVVTSSGSLSGTPPPPPPMPGGKSGGPPPPPPMPGGKVGGPPPLPPMLTGGSAALKPGAPHPLPVQVPKKVVLSPKVLREMDGKEVLRLFNEHLNTLPSNWNGQAEERVEVKTKYGSRVDIVRGKATDSWLNLAKTLSNSLVEKKVENSDGYVMTREDLSRAINNKIDEVRAQNKAVAPTVSAVEQITIEEPTAADITRQLKTLLGNPQTSEISWMVGVKSGIKTLNKLDHDAALKYQEDFIQIMPKEKRFIKP